MAGMTKFALVMFTEDKRRLYYISHVNNIEDFYPKHAKDFLSGREYQVKWEQSFADGTHNHSGYYPAKILLLGVSENEVRHKIKATHKKIKISGVLNSLPSSFTDEEPSSVGRNLKCGATELINAPGNKPSPSCATIVVSGRASTNQSRRICEEAGGSVPTPHVQEKAATKVPGGASLVSNITKVNGEAPTRSSYEELQMKIMELERALACRNESHDQPETPKTVTKEVYEVSAGQSVGLVISNAATEDAGAVSEGLTIDIEDEELKQILEKEFQEPDDYPDIQFADLQDDQDNGIAPAADDIDEEITDDETVAARVMADLQGKKLLDEKNGKVYIGKKCFMKSKMWSLKVRTSKTNSMFVKACSQGIWGQKKLGERTLAGKSRKPGKVKATPRKVDCVMAAFKGYLRVKNIPESRELLREAKTNLSQKMSDVAREHDPDYHNKVKKWNMERKNRLLKNRMAQQVSSDSECD